MSICSINAHLFSLVIRILSGMWEDDKASGHGTLEYSNGDRYEGEWENDQRNGEALLCTCTDVPRHAIQHPSLLGHAFSLSCPPSYEQ